MRKLTLLLFAVMLGMGVMAQTTYDWLNTAPDGNWTQGAGGARWSGGLWNNPPAGGGTILRFNNDTYTQMTNNVTDYSVHQLIFGEYTTSRTISGNPLKFWDYSGNHAKIENWSVENHTISIEIITGTTLQINPVKGDLTFTNKITNNNWIDSYGQSGTSSGKVLTISGELAGTGGLTVKDNSKVVIAANATYTSDTYVNSTGTLELQANLASSKVTVENGGKLIINGENITINDLDVKTGGTVEVLAGKSFTVTGTATNAGTIILKSDATNSTATLVGNVTGTATVEQAAKEVQTYYIGSPVSNITAKSANVGLHITFDETNDAWTKAIDATPFPNDPTFGQGYGVQIAATGTARKFYNYQLNRNT